MGNITRLSFAVASYWDMYVIAYLHFMQINFVYDVLKVISLRIWFAGALSSLLTTYICRYQRLPVFTLVILSSLLRAIMQDVSNDNRVLSLVAQSGIRNILVTLLDQLQRCQKSLNEFLEVQILTFV